MRFVRRKIRLCGSLVGVKRVLVAVSGGPDSVVLLDALHREGFSVVVAHCNFHLRGEASDGDAEFVRGLARRYGEPCYVADFDTERVACERSVSIEMAARDLRYEWFERVADETDCERIAVAHNADDVVETFFLNLTRGSGLQGLSGMAELRGRVVRPLLQVSRRQIMEYIAENELEYRIDATNLETVYTRNKIRHNVIPQLAEINPSFLDTMANNMRFIASAQGIVEAYAAEAYKRVVTEEGERIRFDLKELRKCEGVDTLLFMWLSRYGFSSDVVMQLYRSLDDVAGKQFYSQTHRVVGSTQFLELRMENGELRMEGEVSIDEGDLRIEAGELRIEMLEVDVEGFEVVKSGDVACLDADRLQYPLVLRYWQRGDWFVPYGMKGRKKLSDFFADKKMNLIDKERVWLLTSGDDIVWVVGHRVDARYAVTEKTKRIKIFRL